MDVSQAETSGSIKDRETRRIQAILFVVMMASAVGNSGLQSILPAVGRTLRIPDWMIALTFSLSAVMWSVSAPLWARQLERLGARALIAIGLTGFCLSLTLAAVALTAGLAGLTGVTMTAIALIVSRSLYGTLGPAAPLAAQALAVETSKPDERTRAITVLASGFGLGTIAGPAIAPFFVLPLVGLAGPPLAFVVMGVGVIIAVFLFLPDRRGQQARLDRGAGHEQHSSAPLRLTDIRIRAWMVAGCVSTHVQVVISQTMGFLVIDQLRLDPELAQSRVGVVLSAGAMAMLASQWVLQPLLPMSPRRMVHWGSLLTAAGSAGLAFSHSLLAIAVAFVIASLGFGMVRPGFTAGASLAVDGSEQAAVAGHVTANNGFAFVAGPAAGILLYHLQPGLPYLLSAGASLALVLYLQTRSQM